MDLNSLLQNLLVCSFTIKKKIHPDPELNPYNSKTKFLNALNIYNTVLSWGQIAWFYSIYIDRWLDQNYITGFILYV